MSPRKQICQLQAAVGVAVLIIAFGIPGQCAADNFKTADFAWDAVPSRIAPVSDSIVQHIATSTEKFNDCERRRYFDGAREILGEMLSRSRATFDDGHPFVRHIQSDIRWHGWYVGLTEEQRTVYWKMVEFVDGVDQLEKSGDYHAAVDRLTRAARILKDLEEPAAFDQAVIQIRLSWALNYIGKAEDSIEPAKSGYSIACRCDGEFSPLACQALVAIGSAYHANGQEQYSIRAHFRACRIWNASFLDISKSPGVAEDYANALTWAAAAFRTVEDFDHADRCLQEVHKLITQGVPIDNRGENRVLSDEYSSLETQGRHKEALVKAQELLEFAERSFAPDSEEVCNAKSANAEVLLETGEIDKAIALSDAAVRVKLKQNPSGGIPPCSTTDVHARLLVAKQMYSDAVFALDQRLCDLPTKGGPEFFWARDLLGPYATALHHVGREQDAANVERIQAELRATSNEMRLQIDADPECKFP